MVKCKNCGEEIEDKNFCPNCGTKNEKLVCPSCNFELEEDTLFCPECGEKIKKDEEGEKETLNRGFDDEGEKENLGDSSEDEDEKDESSEKSDDKKETVSSENTDEKKSKEFERCPHCNAKVFLDGSEYCMECGKPINIDIQSFEGIKATLQLKNVVVFSIISIIFSVFLSVIFSYIFGIINPNIDLYPIGFFISLFIIIAIFGSFKDLLNGGLLGILTGLVVGLLCNIIVEFSGGFTFSYHMFQGYAAIVFTIFGAIIGVISTKYFRKTISKYIDIETLL